VHHIDVLRRIHRGRPWIVAADVLAAAPGHLAALACVGVDDVFVVAGSRGTGPAPADVRTVVLDITADDLMAALHAFDDALGELPVDVLAAVDAFDPGNRAAVIAPLFSQRSTAAERSVWGARPASWRALEDKTVVDEVWRAAGVPQAPAVVVPADPPSLRSAASAMDAGEGTAWVADNRQGWHGGASGLRWVRTDEQAAAAAAFMAGRADHVRVMPFLDGVPCSIHGIVLPDSTRALRPCEMVVLRRPGRSELCYAGMASTWDPPADDRELLRAYARQVGDHLRAAVGYRGAFSIDGVMTADGFRPTELNPRFGAALGLLDAGVEVPLYLLHLALVEGVVADWRGADLEHRIVTAADATREIRCHVVVERSVGDHTIGLRREGRGMSVTDGRHAEVTIHGGPAAIGGFVGLSVAPGVVPIGRTAAPLVARALTWADEHLDLGLGPLEAAPDVRWA
jgi:biotin carboxylase